MSWTSQLQQNFDDLKEMAATGLIPGYSLYPRMEEARQQDNMRTLQNMFEGNDFGQSMLEEVLTANGGSMRKSIDILLEMSEQRTQIEAAQKEDAELLLRIKREAEQEQRRRNEEDWNRLEEEKNRNKESFSKQESAEDLSIAMLDFVHVSGKDSSDGESKAGDSNDVSKPEESRLTSNEVSIDPEGSPFIYLKKESAKDEAFSPDGIFEQPKPLYLDLPPPSYEETTKSRPPSKLPSPSAPPMDSFFPALDGNSLYSQNLGQYAQDNFFANSWIPLEFFSSSFPKPMGYDDRNQDILSASVTGTVAKGLKNGLGENNCFLNVVIQSLWHLKAFRTKFVESNQHTHSAEIKEDACPYCALKIIFTQYQFGEEKELPPTVLRKAMSMLFKSQSRFQMGSLNDAAEFHDALMNLLHLSVTGGDEKANSFVHEVFSLHVIDYVKCECGKPQKPFPTKQFIFHVHSEAISKRSLRSTKDGQIGSSIGLDQAIRRTNELDLLPCVNPECQRKNPLRHALANLPQVLTIGLVWDTAKPSVEYIYEIMNLISRQVKVEEMFDSVVASGTYMLRGMITYYGLHYNAFIRNPVTEEWLGFDDSRVFKVGTWDSVVAKCCSGHWQPSVLWYEYGV